jgi:hypothetical protein
VPTATRKGPFGAWGRASGLNVSGNQGEQCKVRQQYLLWLDIVVDEWNEA